MPTLPRLHFDFPLAAGSAVELTGDQAHRLLAVRRTGVGSPLLLFNGRDGEWLAEIAVIGKRSVTVSLKERTRPPHAEPGPWLLFAPVKRLKLDLVMEKATELGVERLQPVFTARTMVERINPDRMRAIAISAAEQCERLTIPELRPALELGAALADWPAGRRLILLDESGGGAGIADVLEALPPGPLAVLAGPEGGFTETELDAVRALGFSVAAGLGPRILRAETALIAALACVQALRGDWRDRKVRDQ